ncbi:MAG: ABC transporter permease [Candidatus Merdivicinus sp.]
MVQASNKNSLKEYLKKHYILYIMLLLPILYYIIFCYIPMGGLVIAFKDYTVRGGIWGSPWVGLEVFEKIFKSAKFWRAVKNTLVLNILSLIIGFPAPIILALMLNELRNGLFKKGIQTILYLPHFLSWVIIGGMATQLLATETGSINMVIKAMGLDPIPFLSNPTTWIGTYVGIGIWQSIGWGAIIYISAIAGIDQEQYEAARVDGCSRFKMTYKITLPNITTTIAIMLILRFGGLVSIGFEQPLMLTNAMVTSVSDVLSTYVYNVGLLQSKFSLATGIGLFQSIINFGMVLLANKLSNRISGESIW